MTSKSLPMYRRLASPPDDVLSAAVSSQLPVPSLLRLFELLCAPRFDHREIHRAGNASIQGVNEVLSTRPRTSSSVFGQGVRTTLATAVRSPTPKRGKGLPTHDGAAWTRLASLPDRHYSFPL